MTYGSVVRREQMNGSAFVYYWIIFAVLVPVFSAVVFFLASKAGYLKDQGRLRYLALWAEVPEEGQEESTKLQAPPCTRGKRSLPLGAGK